MIQDTRYKHRLDDLPNLRIQGYSGRTTWELGLPSTVTISNYRSIEDIHHQRYTSAYNEYTNLCTHVRNLSWIQWITNCNNNINSSEIWRIIKAAKGTALRAPTHYMPQEEADSLCDSFAQLCSPENLHEETINKLIQMAPARIRTITPACTWWNRPEEDLSSGKSESTHSSRTVVKSIEFFYGVESVVPMPPRY